MNEENNHEQEVEVEEPAWREVVGVLLATFGAIYALASIIACINGDVNAGYRQCQVTYNADRFLPARKLGCWLGQEANVPQPNEDPYHE